MKEAVDSLNLIKKEGTFAEKNRIFNCLIKSLAFKKDLFLAKKVYDRLISLNLHRNGYFGNRAVHMFVECGSLDDAIHAFEVVGVKNLWLWSVILNGLCRNGCFEEVLRIFSDFNHTHLSADGFILTSVLRACSSLRNLKVGREVHGLVYRRGYESDLFVSNCLIDMYGKCGCANIARRVFDRMLGRDVVSWNSMLNGYTRKKDFDGFLRLVAEIEAGGMVPNLVTWNTMISCYAFYGHAKEALNCFRKMQLMGVKPDVLSCNVLISALSKSRYFEEALELIRQMQNFGLEPDVASWTTLIGGYVGFGYLKEAVSLFSKLQNSGLLQDEHMFSTVLNACAGLEALEQGKEIHGYIIRNELTVGAFLRESLVHMYVKCGKLDDASKLLSHNNIVSWNTLISGYMQKGNMVEAKGLFQKLQSRYLKPDLVSWNIMINCDAEEGNTEGALGVLARMRAAGISPDSVSWNTLIKGYMRSKQIGDAMQLLSRIDSPSSEQNPGSWNTLMTNHINHGDGEEALRVFHLMRNHGVQPDAITFTCILHACALLGALRIGKSVHGCVMRSNTIDKYIKNGLLEMYIKSRDLGTAWKLFTRIRERNLVLWNGMISGFAKSGKPREAHRLFYEMQAEKLSPDVISWTSILSGYTKSGNANKAFEIWRQMRQSGIQLDPFSITAALKACTESGRLGSGREIHGFSITYGLEKTPSVKAGLITMYFNCGSIKEAVSLFESGPRDITLIWNSMISGYVKHGHGKLALSVFQRMQSEGVDVNYVTLMGVSSACFGTNLDYEDRQYCDLILQDMPLNIVKGTLKMFNNGASEFQSKARFHSAMNYYKHM